MAHMIAVTVLYSRPRQPKPPLRIWLNTDHIVSVADGADTITRITLVDGTNPDAIMVNESADTIVALINDAP